MDIKIFTDRYKLIQKVVFGCWIHVKSSNRTVREYHWKCYTKLWSRLQKSIAALKSNIWVCYLSDSNSIAAPNKTFVCAAAVIRNLDLWLLTPVPYQLSHLASLYLHHKMISFCSSTYFGRRLKPTIASFCNQTSVKNSQAHCQDETLGARKCFHWNLCTSKYPSLIVNVHGAAECLSPINAHLNIDNQVPQIWIENST
jgi:hypothetical protein